MIGLDTPEGIKHNFGVGYNVFIEAKHQYENKLSESGHKAIFDRVRAIFIGREDMNDV